MTSTAPSRTVLRNAGAALLLMGAIGAVHACRTPPRQLAAAEQIALAHDVSLARVVRATPVHEGDDRLLSDGTAPFSLSWRVPPSWDGRLPAASPPPGMQPRSVVYEFAVQERYLGEDRPTFVVHGLPRAQRDEVPRPEMDYRHEAFWAAGGGRLAGKNHCDPQVSFTVGELYVVFLDMRSHTRGFEHVATVDGRPDPGDRWLAFVRAAWPGRAPRATP